MIVWNRLGRAKQGWDMKRKAVIGAIGTAGMVVLMAVPAFGDRGAPGSTFPEQPSTHDSNGCNAVLSAPNQGGHRAEIATGITTGLVVDACFGG